MRVSRWTSALGSAFLAASPYMAHAAGEPVVIGDIDDMSGVYADVEGAGGVEAINMAIADFGGTVLGRKITVLSADHQNKPDIGASKFREWADQQGLNLLLGGSNTGVNTTRTARLIRCTTSTTLPRSPTARRPP
jgi:branched-chain amino acid transport system substrate-binding protein